MTLSKRLPFVLILLTLAVAYGAGAYLAFAAGERVGGAMLLVVYTLAVGSCGYILGDVQ